MGYKSNMLKYGLEFHDTHPLEIERHCIRQGGRWKDKNNGNTVGAGLFHHFKAMETILWPEEYHNRWTDWMLRLLVEQRISVFGACKDSGKTRRVSKWALMDYWCFPDTTLILMTSTTTRGLELRVWGDIKSLWERAHSKFPHLEGNPIDHLHGIFTDKLDKEMATVRDLRKGIIGIPTMNSDKSYDGSALTEFAGIKQVRRRLIGDECFPAGTMVNTPQGLRPIEEIQPGDYVLSAVGMNSVIATSKRDCDRLVNIKTKDGRQLFCTWNHPILTHLGWKKACEIHEGHYIVGFYECMQELRQGNYEQSDVFSEVFLPVDENTGRHWEISNTGTQGESKQKGQGENGIGKQSDENEGMSGEGACVFEGIGPQTNIAWRKRNWSDQSRVAVIENVSRGSVEFRYKDREVERKWLSPGLQGGHSVSEIEISYRSRRSKPLQLEQSETTGRKEGQIFTGAWVDSVAVLQSGDSGFPNTDPNTGRCRVFNLQVEGHPSYCVNGLVVHNCQFVPVDYLKALYAMDSGNFKGAFLGNMIAENGKALDRIAEPEGGWGSEGEVTKSKEWPNKYGGVTLNMVGTDSPNLDPATKNMFPGMMTQESIDRAARLPGAKESVEWWSQILGIRKVGVISDRVLTIPEIQNNGGFGDVVWASTPQKGLAIDAGYGGDDCVKTYFEFGEDVSGTMVIAFKEQNVYPVSIISETTPEDQIANQAKADCERYDIPYENVFIEAGMRATLAVSFGRILSPAINAINFGGTATERPVSNDLFVFDEKTQQRRLKTCFEHYSKFVTEIAFAVRDLVMCHQARLFPMPAAEEFQKRRWEYVYGNRYELETKLEYKERTAGKSPNFSDSIMIAVESARRLGFQIEKPLQDVIVPQITVKDSSGKVVNLPSLRKPRINEIDWLQNEIDQQRKFAEINELSYDN